MRIVLKFSLIATITAPLLFLSGNAFAQSDRYPVPELSQSTQITNSPGDNQRPASDQDQNGQRGIEDGQVQTRQGETNPTQERGNENQPARERLNQTPLPPEPDIEFQEFVASSLGYRLPIFGQELFRNPPSTFAPLDRVPVTPDYLIGPGDELLVRAWGQIDVNYHATVDRTGAIYIPKVGSVSVAGLRYDQLQGTIREAIGRVYKNFDLTVTLGQLRSIQVFVVGQVRRPGVYTISSLSTLVNAIFASGGPSKRGSLRRIQLKRAGQAVTAFDFYDLLANGDKSKDRPLLPGDVIYVPPVGRLVAVAGSVNVPGIFELGEHETLAQVMRYAGGATTTASAGKVVLERIDEHHVRHADELPLTTEGTQRELQDGDVVRFLHLSPKFDKTVTLRGNVALPGRYPYRAGMRVHDLIASREFLMTDEYWKRQNQLGRNPNTGFLLPDERQKLAQDADDRGRRPEAPGATPEDVKNQVKRAGAEINWDYAVVQRINPTDLTTHLEPFNLGKAIEREADQDLPLEPGDVITVFSQNDMQVPIGRQTKFVRLEGEFQTSGVYQATGGETLRHLITRVGGFTPEAYLYGAEFTRESTRVDQQRRLDEYTRDLEQSIERNASAQRNLTGDEAIAERQAVEGQRRLLERLRTLNATGRIVLELKPGADSIASLPDLVLEDGDRLVVPFRPAAVNVLGAVYNNSSFVFRPGKTVGDYLRIAGGVNRNGDKKRAFVIRADGSTVSSQSFHSWMLTSFSGLQLMPGDSVVIPEKLDRGAFARGLRDWTQVIGQFVLGAAAAKVLLQ